MSAILRLKDDSVEEDETSDSKSQEEKISGKETHLTGSGSSHVSKSLKTESLVLMQKIEMGSKIISPVDVTSPVEEKDMAIADEKTIVGDVCSNCGAVWGEVEEIKNDIKSLENRFLELSKFYPQGDALLCYHPLFTAGRQNRVKKSEDGDFKDLFKFLTEDWARMMLLKSCVLKKKA